MYEELETKLISLLKGQNTGLSIECNEHKLYYQSAEDFLSEQNFQHPGFFISPEDRQKCIDTNTIWKISWYPDTPIGCCYILASSLPMALEHLFGVQ